jgi:hypothetical protein
LRFMGEPSLGWLHSCPAVGRRGRPYEKSALFLPKTCHLARKKPVPADTGVDRGRGEYLQV